MNTTVVYDIDHLYKYYPGQTEPANKDISLCILEGEIFGLLGDNGAGKTTLVKQMVNLIRSTSGNIRLYGKSIDKDPLYVPQHIGYMPQNNLALNNLTVSESIYFTAHLRGMSQKESKRECEKLIEQWNLEDIRKRPCIHISGGQKRLLQLSIALAGAPPILILDEPTNDLDPLKRKQVWEVLQKLNREHQVTIIFITHDAIEAEKIIQRIGIMRRGILVAIGKLSELKSKIDQKLRLEMYFTPGNPPYIPASFKPHKINEGHWLVYLDQTQINDVIGFLNTDKLFIFSSISFWLVTTKMDWRQR